MQQGALTHSEKTVFNFIDLHIPLMPQIQERIEAAEAKESNLSNYERL